MKSSTLTTVFVVAVCALAIALTNTADARVFGEPMPMTASNQRLAAAIDALDHDAGPAQAQAFTGRITEVCQKKGCWVVLTDGDQWARVKFANHDIDLPRDLAGPATVYGQLVAVEISDKRAKHYAEDTGDDATEVGGRVEYQIIQASSLLLDSSDKSDAQQKASRT